jgi:hypothetical protein
MPETLLFAIFNLPNASCLLESGRQWAFQQRGFDVSVYQGWVEFLGRIFLHIVVHYIIVSLFIIIAL